MIVQALVVCKMVLALVIVIAARSILVIVQALVVFKMVLALVIAVQKGHFQNGASTSDCDYSSKRGVGTGDCSSKAGI